MEIFFAQSYSRQKMSTVVLQGLIFRATGAENESFYSNEKCRTIANLEPKWELITYIRSLQCLLHRESGTEFAFLRRWRMRPEGCTVVIYL